MRTSNSFKNLITSAFGRFLSIVLVFAVHTVFLATLSEEYAGINGLFTSVLVMLTMTELDIGAAITYSMYKPVAEGTRKRPGPCSGSTGTPIGSSDWRLL